jgi:hypothetical protein
MDGSDTSSLPDVTSISTIASDPSSIFNPAGQQRRLAHARFMVFATKTGSFP